MAEEKLNDQAIFEAARRIDSHDAREAYLQKSCGKDLAQAERVAALLRAFEENASFLESPAVDFGLAPTLNPSVGEKPGTQIGPYKLLQQIGEGGMGVVYMAEQSEPVKRKVALKLIKPGMDSRQIIARFEAERQALSMMDHVNIARVLDAGTIPIADLGLQNVDFKSEISNLKSEISAGRPYFVMELIHGVPITKYCDDNHLTPRQRLELFVPVCQAIQHAHQKGIIHRDIKPSNVMITLYDGKPVPKVIDFGVAKATEQKLTERTLFTQYGTMVGTLEYMSPEQAEMSALGVDTRSDIYSLGVLLYELLTGSTPLSQKRMKEVAFAEILRLIKEEEPPRPSTRLSDSGEALASISALRQTEPARLTQLMRGELDWIVMKTLEKDRNRRYETANGFAADVLRYLNDEPVAACPPSTAYRLRKFARRNKAIFTMVGVVSAALCLGIVGTTWQAIDASLQRDRAVAAEKLAQTRLESETLARHEASRNLREARKAVDDWFTKISQTALLEAPGLQPLRQELLEAALKYYQRLAEQAQDNPDLRADLAAAHMRLSMIYVSSDRNDDAIEAFLRGLELVEQLIQERPDDAEFPRRLAGYFRMGRSFYQRTRPPSDPIRALRTLQNAASLWEQFARNNPENPEFQSDLAGLYALLSALVQFSDKEQSLTYSVKARTLLEKLVQDQPDSTVYHELLVLVYIENEDALGRLGRVQEREQVGAQSIQYFENLVQKFPAEAMVQRSLAKVHIKHASRMRGTRPIEAEQMYRQALKIFENLVSRSQPNAHDRYDLRVTCNDLAELLQKDGRNEEAEVFAGKAMTINEKLVIDFPDSPEFRLDLAKRHESAADEIRESLPREAERAYRQALAFHEQIVADFPDQERFRTELARCFGKLIALLQSTGTTADLEILYHEAIAQAERLANKSPNGSTWHTDLARNHNRLGILLRNAGRVPEAEIELARAQEIWLAFSGPELERLQQVAEADPQNGNRWGELAIAYYRAGKWEDSLGIYSDKRHLGWGIAGSAWQWLYIAMAHWQLNHQEEARRWYYKSVDWVEGAQQRNVFALQQEAALLLGLPDPTQRMEQAWSHVETGASLEKESKLDKAKVAYGKAIENYDSLATDYPAVFGYSRKLIVLLGKYGRQEQLEACCRRMIAAREVLPDASPELRLENANQCNELAFLLPLDRRATEGESLVRRAIVLKQGLATEFPDNSEYRFHLAHSNLGLANILQASSREADAKQVRTEAGSIFSQLAADESVDARGNRHSFTYDSTGAQTQLIDPLGRRTTSAYDAAGQQNLRIDARSNRTTYVYSTVGQLTGRKYPDGSRATLSYDTVGNRTLMADSTGRYTNVFDAVGQSTSAALPNSKRITNTFDRVGNRRTKNSANGRTTWTYDAADQLTSEVNGNAKRTTFTYDDAGRRTQQKANDGSRTSWTYDAASNLTKVQDKKADNSTINSFDYRTDNGGNRIGATLASGVRITWVYDKSNQLTAERRSGVSGYANTFVYDSVGNRSVLNANGTRTTTVYDNANQIKYSTAAAGRTTYTFDANGNQQIVREPSGGRTTTTWNYENQPTLFRMPDGSRVTMTYNANNRRVGKE